MGKGKKSQTRGCLPFLNLAYPFLSPSKGAGSLLTTESQGCLWEGIKSS